jgi:hypothetical protein
MGSEILHNPHRLRIGEPHLDPPCEPNPVRLAPEDCSYEVLCAHLFDEALDVEPQTRSKQVAVRTLLLGIYAVMGVREIRLSAHEEAEWRRA